MATTKAIEEPKKEEKFLIMLPPANDKEENFVIVGVNGKLTKIQKGVPVYVTGAVKAVLDNARVASKVLEASKEKAAKKAEKAK